MKKIETGRQLRPAFTKLETGYNRIQDGEMKILVIEDDTECLESIALAFRIYLPETEVITAYRGLKGVELVKINMPDAVILGLGLPDIGGFEVLEKIRTFSDTPVIILTARMEEEDRTRGMALGADDYMRKPFKPQQLLTRVREIVAS